MIRLAFFFSALFLAAVMDMRTRTIPDCLVVLVALTSMLPPEQPNLLGVFAGLPLLLAGITIGGIGGGDVKLMGVCGLVLGASQAFTGLFLALCLLVLWHDHICTKKTAIIICCMQKEEPDRNTASVSQEAGR